MHIESKLWIIFSLRLLVILSTLIQLEFLFVRQRIVFFLVKHELVFCRDLDWDWHLITGSYDFIEFSSHLWHKVFICNDDCGFKN